MNVTPIDLAPLVNTISDVQERNQFATKLLIDSLHEAKPKPPYVWDRQPWHGDRAGSVGSIDTKVAELVNVWRAEREAAPGWVVAPYYERQLLRSETFYAATYMLKDFDSISSPLRARFASELAWRLDVGHFGVPAPFNYLLLSAIEDPDPKINEEERALMGRVLCFAAIEKRDVAEYRQQVSRLEAIQGAYDVKPWLAYLKALNARNELDFSTVKALLPEVLGSDPVWAFRRAYLHSVICEYGVAAKILREALNEIRKKRILDRRSIWLVSREAWARLLCMNFVFDFDDGEPGFGDNFGEWPTIYKEYGVDPWDQLNDLDRGIQEEHELNSSYLNMERAHFDAGTWSPRSKKARHSDLRDVSAEWQIRRLSDTLGLPSKLVDRRLARAMRSECSINGEGFIWRTALSIQTNHGELADVVFGRIQVAAMPTELVNDLVVALRRTIDFLSAGLNEGESGLAEKVDRLRSYIEILSRLAVRCTAEVAEGLVGFALLVVDRNASDHFWLFKSIGNLISRSLSAMPPSVRGAQAGHMLAFPLPVERTKVRKERDWPEFSDEFRSRDVIVDRPVKIWDRRIAELIECVESGDADNRYRSISRLEPMYLKGVLTEDECTAFAQALWSRREGSDRLPDDASYFPSVFFRLAAPESVMVDRAFFHNALAPLLGGSIDTGALETLAYVGSETDRGRAERPFTPETALQLIHRIPIPSRGSVSDPVCAAISFGCLPIVTLDASAVEKLWECAIRENPQGALFFLPYVVRAEPQRTAQAVAHLRRSINSREYEVSRTALLSIKEWIRINPIIGFPKIFSSSVASLIAMRTEPALFHALDVAVDLVQAHLMSEDNISSVLDGLVGLIEETDYNRWREGDLRTSTLTFTRANAFRLAKALKKAGHAENVIDDWIQSGSLDSVPEVRFVPDRLD